VLDARLSYFYGDAGELPYQGDRVALALPAPDDRGLADDYAAAGALFVNGQPYLKEPLAPLERPAITVSRIPQTTDMMLNVAVDTDQIVYFDGSAFLLLLEHGDAGKQQRVVPRQLINGLRGLGQLSAGEADMLQRAVRSAGQPAVLAFLPPDSLPAHAVDGLDDHRRTGVYVQTAIGTDQGAFRPAPVELTWELLASGSQAVGFPNATYRLVADQGSLLTLWNRAHGHQLTVPNLPPIDFERETVVALFAGEKSSGGYGVSVSSVTEQNGELYVDVTFSTPAPGSLTTQALTSPWALVRVLRGGYQVAWLRDAQTGDLIGAARADF
jgi:hypothetical protein